MKQKAILYIRVSTDEQNDGYSPADQKARLIKYCENSNIDIVGIYHEDESGKNFNRPEWLNILAFIKKNRGLVDVMLFIKWDRFSRNIAEAYIAIKKLRDYGVEPQAIEQPLNFEIPESKIMLAVYLAAPEVDNDRRALNIFHGVRRAKKEGRWIGSCLRGYKNARNENNRPIMIPESGATESLIKEAFELFASETYQIEELRKLMNKRGLKISRNGFWVMLRNKGYIGKVCVPAYKDEPLEWVQGDHKPIIDESLFYNVQDILEGRKKKTPAKNLTMRIEFPLRGFLICPQCKSNLTASASTSRTGKKFFYYHCSKGCKERQKADLVNDTFMDVLRIFKIDSGAGQIYALKLKELLHGNNKKGKEQLIEIAKEIEKQTQRLKNARALMLDGEISSGEYKEMRIDIEETINRLSLQESQLRVSNEDFTKQINFCTMLFTNIDKYYISGDTEVKRKIIGSIFPEGLTFENNKYRTTKINEVVSLICLSDRQLQGNKKGKRSISETLSLQVVS